MKTIFRYSWALLIAGFISMVNAYSQSAQPNPGETPMLTGHAKKIESIIKDTTDIVVANFTKLGFPNPDATGQDSYDQAEIEITSVLKGALTENESQGLLHSAINARKESRGAACYRCQIRYVHSKTWSNGV